MKTIKGIIDEMSKVKEEFLYYLSRNICFDGGGSPRIKLSYKKGCDTFKATISDSKYSKYKEIYSAGIYRKDYLQEMKNFEIDGAEYKPVEFETDEQNIKWVDRRTLRSTSLFFPEDPRLEKKTDGDKQLYGIVGTKATITYKRIA